AALKLRYSHPHVHRPYVHPWGMAGIWVSTIMVTFWIVLGSWVAVFPDTLERLFGVGYGFKGSWGVSQGTFEGLTLGTLATIVVATGGFSRANANASVAEAAAQARAIVDAAGVPTTVTISVAFGCPFEGRVDPGDVAELAAPFAGRAEVVLADTIGVATPSQV